MIAAGLGIGVLSEWTDGFYSAICLFVLPIIVALAGASIIDDFTARACDTKSQMSSSRKETTGPEAA